MCRYCAVQDVCVGTEQYCKYPGDGIFLDRDCHFPTMAVPCLLSGTWYLAVDGAEGDLLRVTSGDFSTPMHFCSRATDVSW